jgi:uncharacterized membrane protein
MRKSYIVLALIILLSFAIGILLYPTMMPYMASHWNIKGEVNGYMPKFWGLFLMPILSLALILLFMLIPKLDPLGRNIEKFRNYYDTFVVLIISFLFYLHIITIFWNLGAKFDMNRLLSPAIAILFFYCGILLYHAKRNWSVGIRTAWTLSSDYVWNKTHKLGGKLFAIAGLICLLGVVFPRYAFLFILVPILSAAIISVLYSYILFTREKKAKMLARAKTNARQKKRAPKPGKRR